MVANSGADSFRISAFSRCFCMAFSSVQFSEMVWWTFLLARALGRNFSGDADPTAAGDFMGLTDVRFVVGFFVGLEVVVSRSMGMGSLTPSLRGRRAATEVRDLNSVAGRALAARTTFARRWFGSRGLGLGERKTFL